MRTVTFPAGGLYPVRRKEAVHRSAVRNAILPSVSIVALRQSHGPDAELCVAPGDRVGEGTRIGRATGALSAHVHSPIPGLIREIRPVTLPDGVISTAAVIDLAGAFDRLGKVPARHEWTTLRPGALLRLIEDAGVVGMSGVSQPTHTALDARAAATCRWLIVNGAESEPYVCADHRLMLEHPAEIFEGLQIVERLLAPDRVAVGVGVDKRDAMRRLRAHDNDGRRRDYVRLSVKYPQGDERQLIRAVTGLEVPSSGYAYDVGCVTISPATLYAIWEAVVTRKPLIERVVTVAGRGVARPANIKVRIGTPIGGLLAECGGLTDPDARIVVGGPLRGYATTDLTTPVLKYTTAVLALTAAEVRAAPTVDCIRCGRCAEACPMRLDPARLYKLVAHGRCDDAVNEGLYDCTECGGCGYVCPSRIPLVDGLRSGKVSR